MRNAQEETAVLLPAARQQKANVKGILEVALEMQPRLNDLEFDQKADLLDLMDGEVQATGAVPGMLRSADCPFDLWFRPRPTT